MNTSIVSEGTPPQLTARGLRQAGNRIGLICIAVAGALVATAFAVDPWAPAGCPDSIANGKDCARYGGAGRLYAANLQVRANNAATPEEALELTNRVIALRPNFAYAHNTRGLANASLGNLDQAIADYTRAMDLFPDYGGAIANRAVTYQGMGKRSEAARDFRAVYDLPPTSHNYEHSVGYARYHDRTTAGPKG